MIFGHTGDIHIYKIDEPLNSLEFIINSSISKGVELLIIAGDLFDGSMTADEDSGYTRLINLLKEASTKIAILIIKGNHDKPGSIQALHNIGINNRIYATEQNELVQLIKGNYLVPFSDKNIDVEANITTICYPEKTTLLSHEEITDNNIATMNILVEDKIKQQLLHFDSLITNDKPRIVTAHLSVKGYLKDNGQKSFGGDDFNISLDTINITKPDYVALAHIHKAQDFGPSYPRTVYPSSAWSVNFGELDDKFYSIIKIDKTSYSREQIKIPCNKRYVETFVINTKKELEEFNDIYKKYSKLLSLNPNYSYKISLIIDEYLYDNAIFEDIKNMTINKIKNKKNIIIDDLDKSISDSKTVLDELIGYAKNSNIKLDDEHKEILESIEQEYKATINIIED